MYGIDMLEADGPLTEYDYGFLKGDKLMWPQWGAALNVTMEWCYNKGYGDFGQPTEQGLKAMKEYENRQTQGVTGS